MKYRKYDLILARRSQIFEYLRQTLCRGAIRYLDPAPSKKGFFLRKRLAIIIAFFKGCDWLGHVFASSASLLLDPEHKTWLRTICRGVERMV